MARVGRPHLRIAGKNDDPWGGIDGAEEYDPDGFYVRSLNKHDHSMSTRVPMHPEVYAEISRMLASGELAGTPITSYGAFMRDAAVHEMHRIARLTKNNRLEEFATMQRILATSDQIAAEAEQFRKLITEADERLNLATKTGDKRFVEVLLDLYEPAVAMLHEPYASELEDACKDARSWLRAKR